MARAKLSAAKLIMAAMRHVDRRRIDEVECVVSVLLAIVVAHAIGATNIQWAAFAGYMVMRGHVADTLSRGTLRIVGTVAGGLLALAAAPILSRHLAFAALGLALVGTASLYTAMTARRAYAWLFFGLTFAMVLLDKIERPKIALEAFVGTRILETLAGTLACVAVSLASAVTLRRYWPAERAPAPSAIRWHPEAFRHAAQAGIALMALVALSAWLHVPALSQSAITIMAVMLLPVTGIGASGFRPVSVRLAQRFVGCIAGGALAAATLFAAHGSPLVLVTGTAIGVVIGRHLENGAHAHRYVGTQFTLALLITLVPDSYADAEIAPALERLSGILIGMAVLEPVLLAWHLISPSRAAAAAQGSASEPGGL